MNPQDRQQHWDHVYTNKSPDEVSWFQQEPTTSLQMIKDTGSAPDAPVIDVGGGASRLVDRLFDAGYSNLSVLDISPASLEYAKHRLGENAKNINWIAADVTEFIAPQSYAIWHDRAVFHFLTEDSDRRKYVTVLKNSLPVGGHVIIAAFAVGGPTKCSGLDIVQYDAKKLMDELGDGFTLAGETSETHITPGGGKQQFSCFRLTRTN